MVIVIPFIIEPVQRARGLRICITASLVNFALFYAIHHAQKKNRKPE